MPLRPACLGKGDAVTPPSSQLLRTSDAELGLPAHASDADRATERRRQIGLRLGRRPRAHEAPLTPGRRARDVEQQRMHIS